MNIAENTIFALVALAAIVACVGIPHWIVNYHKETEAWKPLRIVKAFPIYLAASIALLMAAGSIASALITASAAATCTNCGAELAGEFCSECGSAAETIAKCIECGVEAVGKFCSNCGAALK